MKLESVAMESQCWIQNERENSEGCATQERRKGERKEGSRLLLGGEFPFVHVSLVEWEDLDLFVGCHLGLKFWELIFGFQI